MTLCHLFAIRCTSRLAWISQQSRVGGHKGDDSKGSVLNSPVQSQLNIDKTARASEKNP